MRLPVMLRSLIVGALITPSYAMEEIVLEEPVFLLPKEREDPIRLRPFFSQHAFPLISLYDQVQTAKAAADITTLLKLKEDFDGYFLLVEEWDILAERLVRDLKGEPIEYWQGQSSKQLIGSLLFYPQEALPEYLEDILKLCYPGLITCLAISATYDNPVASYHLSSFFPYYMQEARLENEDIREELAVQEEENEFAEPLRAQALKQFRQCPETNRVAQLYLLTADNIYSRSRCQETLIRQLEALQLPHAYDIIGNLYKDKATTHVGEKRLRLEEVENNKKLAYSYYRRALEQGYENAVLGIHCLREYAQSEEELNALYEAGHGQGLSLKASLCIRKGQLHEARSFYKRSGLQGRLYSYITLVDEALENDMPREKRLKEIFFYSFKADRSGYAKGSRSLLRSHELFSTPKEKLEMLLRMVNLKDRKGYQWFLMCWDRGRFSDIPGISFSREEIDSRFQALLQERQKVVGLVKSLIKRRE